MILHSSGGFGCWPSLWVLVSTPVAFYLSSLGIFVFCNRHFGPMSSPAISFISSPNSLTLTHVSPTNTNAILFTAITSCRVSYLKLKPPSISSIFIRISCGSFKKKASFFTSSRPFSLVMEWQDCTVKMEIDVPASVAYKCYSDREVIPNWMSFISSIKAKNKPDLSRWSLKYKALDRDLEYSWLVRNMQPSPNQRIHWRSLEGLPNSWFTLEDEYCQECSWQMKIVKEMQLEEEDCQSRCMDFNNPLKLCHFQQQYCCEV